MKSWETLCEIVFYLILPMSGSQSTKIDNLYSVEMHCWSSLFYYPQKYLVVKYLGLIHVDVCHLMSGVFLRTRYSQTKIKYRESTGNDTNGCVLAYTYSNLNIVTAWMRKLLNNAWLFNVSLQVLQSIFRLVGHWPGGSAGRVSVSWHCARLQWCLATFEKPN